MGKTPSTPIVIENLDNVVVGGEYTFEGVIKKAIYIGESDKKRPSKFLAQFENSNQKLALVNWDHGDDETLTELAKSRLICNITFKIKESTFKDESIRYDLISFVATTKTSSIIDEEEAPEEKGAVVSNVEKYKPAFRAIIDNISNANYKTLLSTLILENDNFFEWPAAYSVHHAFNGGLAMHTLGVYNNGINLYNQYKNKITFDKDLLETGLLLHDIGKLIEYNNDKSVSLIGNMISHLVLGVEMIDDVCDAYNIDKFSDEMIKLKHIIVSHHGELQFGSPNEPVIPEAYVVNAADREDAKMQTVSETLAKMSINQNLKMPGSGRIIKTN